jgi:hypothetical protein
VFKWVFYLSVFSSVLQHSCKTIPWFRVIPISVILQKCVKAGTRLPGFLRRQSTVLKLNIGKEKSLQLAGIVHQSFASLFFKVLLLFRINA